MFKKLIKKGVALACGIVMSFSVVGCADVPESKVTYDIWTTYNTMKVIRETGLNDNYVKMEKGINVKMAKGEGEMGSLYVTTGDKGIDEFDLVPQNLTNENGDIFSVENMEVFAQRYIKVSVRSRNITYEQYPLGCYAPDAIVDIDLYRKNGEDKIMPNSNQGFTVDFKTTADTPAGVYTGDFQLVLNDDIIDIPVSVTVWDYTVPAESAATSCVLIYEDSIIQGEMTSVTEEVDAWYRVYYEQALEYKMNPYMVPESTKGPAKFVENVLRYFDHPNFATFGLPHQTFLESYSGTYADQAGIFIKEDGSYDEDKADRYGDCMDYWFDCLYLLGWKAAANDVNYFEECYLDPIDEPNGADELLIALEWMEDLKQLKNDVADRLVKDGAFSATDPIVDSIRDIDIICTALGDEPALNKYDVIYCPEPYEWLEYSIQTNIEKHAAENNNPLWYYTQIDKIGDGPNSFVDDYMVAGRILKWMQKYYNLDGWLYWNYNEYLQKIAFESGYKVINPYENIVRDSGSATGAMGDGYFVYPASKYGADEPIKTVRLLTYRDSQEDMDTLNYLESIYREYENYYGVDTGTFDVNTVLKGVYDRIFCRSTAYRDDAVFDECREILKDTILNATKNDNKFVYNLDYVGKTATYTFYTAPGYQIKVNGNVISSVASGEGLKHTFEMDASINAPLSSVQLVKDGESTTMELFEQQEKRALDMTASTFNVSVSEGSTMAQVGTGYRFTIKSSEVVEYFIPSIKFETVPETFNVIELDLVNNTDELVNMTLRIVDTNGIAYSADIGLTANTARMVEVINGLSEGRKVASVSIRFENRKEVDGEFVTIKDRLIEVNGIRVK